MMLSQLLDFLRKTTTESGGVSTQMDNCRRLGTGGDYDSVQMVRVVTEFAGKITPKKARKTLIEQFLDGEGAKAATLSQRRLVAIEHSAGFGGIVAAESANR